MINCLSPLVELPGFHCVSSSRSPESLVQTEGGDSAAQQLREEAESGWTDLLL